MSPIFQSVCVFREADCILQGVVNCQHLCYVPAKQVWVLKGMDVSVGAGASPQPLD